MSSHSSTKKWPLVQAGSRHALPLPLVIACALAWGAMGCGDSKPPVNPAVGGSAGGAAGGSAGGAAGGSAGGAAGGSAGGSAGGAAGGANGGNGASAQPAGIAVLVSDYSSAAVSLLDPVTLTLSKDACISAASFSSSLVALSGDAAVASSPSASHELVVIDRKNSVLTFASPITCTVRAQLSVGTGGFKANPQDVLVLSEHKAYVTRYETNHAPVASLNGLDGGDDILIIDPSVPTITGRIALSTYATAGATGPTQARPARLLRAGARVLVALDSLNAKLSEQGPGRVLALDPDTDQVTGSLDVPTLKNCGAFAYDTASKHLVVSCGGSFSAASQIAESGLVTFDLGSEPVSVATVKASALGTQPLSFATVSLGGANTAFVAALGSLDFTTNAVLSNDTFLRVDLTAGTATKLLSSSPYGLGGHLVVNGKVVLADGDATHPLLHVLSADGTPGDSTVDPDPAHHLPPRQLAFY